MILFLGMAAMPFPLWCPFVIEDDCLAYFIITILIMRGFCVGMACVFAVEWRVCLRWLLSLALRNLCKGDLHLQQVPAISTYIHQLRYIHTHKGSETQQK